MAGDTGAELLSPLPLETCLGLLGGQIDSSWGRGKDRPLIGSLRGSTLRATKRIAYRNSFQTQLTARLSARGDGTLVECRFAMNSFVVVFMAMWFTLVVTVGGAATIATLYSFATDPQHTPHKDWTGVFVPLGMMLGGAAMVWVGRSIARNERDEMLALVATTLQAEPPKGKPRA